MSCCYLCQVRAVYNLSPGQINGLASRCKFWTCVQLVFRLATHLHRLATTCVDLRWLWSSSNLDTSRRKFLPFGHPAQVDTRWSQVICCSKNVLTNDVREIYGFLQLASWLANLFGRPSQVRTQVLVSQTCIDLHWLVSPFGQGFKLQPYLDCRMVHCIYL